MLRDLRFALRGLRSTPVFTGLAVLTLALGMGASAAIFTLVDNVFLTGLAFENAGQIQRLYSEAPERGANQFPWSEAKFRFFRERQTAFSAVAADTFAGYTLTGIGDPVLLNGQRVTPSLFSMLGIRPTQGRLFLDDEEEDGPDLAVVSESFWTNRLSREPGVIGRTLILDDRPFEIIGVIADPPVTVFGPTEIWTTRPFTFPGYTEELRTRGVGFLRVWGRIKDRLPVDQALSHATDLTQLYAKEHPEKVDAALVTGMHSLETETVGNLRPAFLLLLGAVGLVLLIASSNVANLLLVRFVSRRREVALRMALGSPRNRIIRLFLFESLTVSLLAVAVGAAVGQFALRGFTALLTGIPVTGELTLNPFVLGVTLAVGLLTGLVTGAYPALQAAKAETVEAIKEGGRSHTASRNQHRFRMTLVSAQVALSCVLLVGALLLLASFQRLQAVDLGFESDDLLVAAVNLPRRFGTTEEQTLAVERLIESLRARPGITAASAAMGVPMTGFGVQGPYSRTDPELPYNDRPIAFFRYIGDGYLDTLGAGLLAGRVFDASDFANPGRTVLVSQQLAETAFPNENAVGRSLLIGSRGGGERVEIIGVIKHVQSVSLTDPPPLEVYRTFNERLAAGGFFQLMVRNASGDPMASLPTIRAALDDLGPNIPIIQPSSMTEVIGGAIAQQRLLLALLGSFAALAVLLAIIGLYSVLAFLVGQRATEIGVRLALGAQRTQVTGLIWRQGMLPVTLGVIVGLFAAAGLSRLAQSQLFGTTATDPTTYAITSTSLLLAAALACAVPAWRASRAALAEMLR